MSLRLDLEIVFCTDFFFLNWFLSERWHSYCKKECLLSWELCLPLRITIITVLSVNESHTCQYMFPYFYHWRTLVVLHLYLLGASQIWTSHLSTLQYNFCNSTDGAPITFRLITSWYFSSTDLNFISFGMRRNSFLPVGPPDTHRCNHSSTLISSALVWYRFSTSA